MPKKKIMLKCQKNCHKSSSYRRRVGNQSHNLYRVEVLKNFRIFILLPPWNFAFWSWQVKFCVGGRVGAGEWGPDWESFQVTWWALPSGYKDIFSPGLFLTLGHSKLLLVTGKISDIHSVLSRLPYWPGFPWVALHATFIHLLFPAGCKTETVRFIVAGGLRGSSTSAWKNQWIRWTYALFFMCSLRRCLTYWLPVLTLTCMTSREKKKV